MVLIETPDIAVCFLELLIAFSLSLGGESTVTVVTVTITVAVHDFLLNI